MNVYIEFIKDIIKIRLDFIGDFFQVLDGFRLIKPVVGQIIINFYAAF